MTKANWFWLVFVIFLVLALWFSWPMGWNVSGVIVVVFILLGLLGWSQFGGPIKG